MNIEAWKEFKEEDSSIRCRIQVSYKDGRRIKTLLRELEGWIECGSGYNAKNKEDILLFAKSFKNDTSWKKFLRNFPFTISEILRNNNKKVYNARKSR